MIAFASASDCAALSDSTSNPRTQRSQRQEDEEQPSTGVKNVFSRVLNRRLSSYNVNKNSTPVAPAELTPPPSRQQQLQQQQQPHPPMSMPMPMQPSIRHGPQLHNPQNTLRAMSTPAGNVQDQGHIDNGHVVAPLSELEEENSQLQVPSTTRRPSTTPGAGDVALTSSAPSSTSAAPPATKETGLLGRLMRRRPVPKQRDAENHKKPGNSASIGDSPNQPSGVDVGIQGSTDPVPVADETSVHLQTQSHSLPLNNPSSHKTHKSPSGTPKSGTVSNARITSKSSVPRFLRQMTKPRQASEAMTQTASPQQPAPSSTTRPKLLSKRSSGKRFWSRPSANDFGEDDNHVAKTESPRVPPAHRTVYVPKHAAADFSRTINPRLNRQSLVVGDDQVKVLRAQATTTADARVGEPETQQKQGPLAVATVDKHTARDLSMSKYEAPSPTELHRRLEIIKRSESEVVGMTEPASLNPWQHQLNLLQANSNASASNTKAPFPKGHSRSISSRRHSFSLISDPHARELTPPRSASPVETEAPTDPTSQMPQQMVSGAPARPTSFYDCTRQNRQDGPVKQAAAREMTDFERFLVEAEAREREHQAQMWRNLARRSGHYGYSDNPWNAARPVDPSLAGTGAVNATTSRNNKRNSAPYPVNRRESMMSELYGPPTGTNGPSGDDADATRGLARQGSVSKRISHYIKPPKPSAQPTYEDWPTGRANRRSVIVGAIGE
ncbi:hypothetical protein LY76DRAFT_622868 [Colletotrichum caudatum]|nr:hypothetical protein LY76DRAFT_622868 [Colletotrichum caudatum]